MDGQLLRNAGIDKADAVIVGNAHDADPKDVSMRTALCRFIIVTWACVTASCDVIITWSSVIVSCSFITTWAGILCHAAGT